MEEACWICLKLPLRAHCTFGTAINRGKNEKAPFANGTEGHTFRKCVPRGTIGGVRKPGVGNE